MNQLTFFESEPNFVGRKVSEVTFQGKLLLPIHRWYRLTPSFSPRLALDIASSFGLNSRDFVLDPFSGVGTVPLCMKYQGIPACSVELNPYLLFVGTVKTRTYHDVDAIEETFGRFLGLLKVELKGLPSENAADGYLNEHPDWIPRISNPERWWSPGNLMQLISLRRLIADFDAEPHHLDLIKMGVLGILIPVSNAKHNHVSLSFAPKPLPMVDLLDVLKAKLEVITDDLRAMRNISCSDVSVYPGNSKSLSTVLLPEERPSAVVTSPPYPNRFSYARETRPHLFFFDFIESAQAVGELETDAIGGTWGKATSVLTAGIDPANNLIESLLAPYTTHINGSSPLMAYYVTKYFNNIYEHAREIAIVCQKRARLAYVIGNSKFYEHPLPSDEILACIFGHFGFELERIDRMRKRQSKSGLYEAVVFMQR